MRSGVLVQGGIDWAHSVHDVGMLVQRRLVHFMMVRKAKTEAGRDWASNSPFKDSSPVAQHSLTSPVSRG